MDATGHHRQAASRCSVASAILGLGGALMIGTGAVANAIRLREGDFAQVVGIFTLAVSGLFFIGFVIAATHKKKG
jgi:hypothetical protein